MLDGAAHYLPHHVTPHTASVKVCTILAYQFG